MPARISASIVVYKNNPVILHQAIRSFLDTTSGGKLYLINNSPEANLRLSIKSERLIIINNKTNIGFGRGHNIALKKVIEDNESTYHIVLNPDVYFFNDVIEKMISFMDDHPRVGLAMPKVLYPDGKLQPLCRLLPSPITLFTRRFLPFVPVLKKINRDYEMHFSGYDKIMDVPFISGCFMFLRVDTLKAVGIFDERIFLYTEDIDLSRRIHQLYRTVFFPEATIYHYNERASYRNVFRLINHIQSAILYFNKWGWFTDTERDVINQRALLKVTR